jgi:wyosine [tRNA(Phe)-imidazoG37] synthetase (radical SAM superfamily)
MISFGPIPSRRLGKSLGINNITSQKTCSYSCIYCQVGTTDRYSHVREKFYDTEVVFSEVCKHLEKLHGDEKPDYLTFVANGEPTLDINLGKSIEKLKTLSIPVAVITNASLLHMPQVRDDLKLSDWVSVKVDAYDEMVWKKINRPCPSINFEEYIDGLFQFSSVFKGKLVTESMLVKDVNDKSEILSRTAKLIKQIKPATAYISVPTRPPCVKSVEKPDESIINTAYQIFSDAGLNVELILGFEGTNAGHTGNIFDDILNICAVHPIREDTMRELIIKNNADISVINSLIDNKLIKEVNWGLNKFYIRDMHM